MLLLRMLCYHMSLTCCRKGHHTPTTLPLVQTPLPNRRAHSKATHSDLVTDMNIHFDNPLQSLTKQTLTTLSIYNLVQVINKPAHRCGHIIDWIIVRPDDDIHKNLLLQTHLNQTIIAPNPTSMFQSLGLLPYTGLLGTLLTLTAHHLLLNFPVFQTFHLLKRQCSSVTFCALY